VAHASGATLAITVMREHLEQEETAINSLESAVYLTGWVPMGVTLTYSSVDDPTGVVTSSVDISAYLSVGMRIKFTNGGNTIYGIVTAISGTTITFLHEIDPTDSLALTLMANSAITSPFFSYHKAPYGFPLDPRKWTVYDESHVISSDQASPIVDTWYNTGSVSKAFPIGAWNMRYIAALECVKASATSVSVAITLSTGASTETDGDFTCRQLIGGASGTLDLITTITCHAYKALAAKTTYYLNILTGISTVNSIRLRGDQTKTRVEGICAYL
jgi:hypothetical protein